MLRSRRTHTYRVWLPAECIAGALSLLSIHSSDYVFIVLVSIFMKTITFSKGHPSAINMFSLVYIVIVMEFFASITRACALRMIRTTYERLYEQTYLYLQRCVSALRCWDKSSQCTKMKYQCWSLMPYLKPFTIVSDQSWSRYACCGRCSMPLLAFTSYCFHAKLNLHPTVFHALFYGLVWKQIVPFAFGYLFVVLE